LQSHQIRELAYGIPANLASFLATPEPDIIVQAEELGTVGPLIESKVKAEEN
jgi:hypothetical protein